MVERQFDILKRERVRAAESQPQTQAAQMPIQGNSGPAAPQGIPAPTPSAQQSQVQPQATSIETPRAQEEAENNGTAPQPATATSAPAPPPDSQPQAEVRSNVPVDIKFVGPCKKSIVHRKDHKNLVMIKQFNPFPHTKLSSLQRTYTLFGTSLID